MKFAFISDIHANLPALLAVLKDISQHAPDDIYCLGDLVNFAGWDNEVIALMRQKGITAIQGNHDEGIAYNRHDFPFSYNTAAQKEFGHLSIRHVNNVITPDNRAFLGNLPFMLQLKFAFPFHPLRIAMVHGSPSSINEYVYSSATDEYLLELLDVADADILLMGHTHIPFHRSIFCDNENRKKYKHAVNVGSVGKPKHGNNLACYTIMEISRESDLSEASSIRVNFEYVPYNVEEVISHIKKIGLTSAYDQFLMNG
jgi:predicted phosphodiesterase